MRTILFLVSLVAVLSLAACASIATPTANLPNPASVYCTENGGTLEIRTAADGSQTGVCVFADGSECDEWAFFRGECAPSSSVPQPTQTPPAPVVDSAGWFIYTDSTLGYTFHYPSDTVIVANDEPLKSITISGTDAAEENWPQITLSHPTDREEYRPPEGSDLRQWLTDHYMLESEPLADVQISGVTAVHLRHDRSPQSYAYDRYYFAHADQLYMLVIGHAADHEDWDTYNYFLENFTFAE